jgi:PilZ domain
LADWQKPGEKDAVRTAVRFPLRIVLHLKTADGMVEATTRDISSNGLLFVTNHLPTIGSSIEFTMDLPSEVMGSASDISVHCTGRVVRHQLTGEESMAAAVIDEYVLKA